MPVPSDLKYFPLPEWKQPGRMNTQFVRWLDRVREKAGVPMRLTDDGRADGDPEPSGSAGKRSLHHRGCAVDLDSRLWNARQKWSVLAAIVELSKDSPDGWVVELEVVYNEKGDHHWHVGLDWATGKQNEFIEADD